MPTHIAIFHETKLLLDQGLNLIAVRDKQEGNYAAKTPYHGWKEFQKRQVTHEELSHYLTINNTNAVAIICGAISGNLEVIDVDVKHEPGIDALLFDAIKDIYPNLWHILRIHKTPSGGYHILYKVIGKDVEGNKKLAEREATNEELSKSKSKKKAFIETRGEGGYVLAPPSFGYAIFKNNEIPIISWEDRCSLINICRSFTQIKEEVKEKPPQHKADDTFYDEKPWDDYDRHCDLLSLVEQHGWRFVKKRANKIWLTKPGGKANEVHAAIFTTDKSGAPANLFYIHTTDTELTPNKVYTPSQFITHVQFAGDWKQSSRWFVSQGFGRIKPQVEQNYIKTGKELPPNASQEAKTEQQQHIQLQEEAHPYGIFWEVNEKDKYCISRERLYTIAEQLGFRLHKQQIVRIAKPFIYEQTQTQFFNAIKQYIKEEDGDLYEDICNCYEAFLQESGRFTISRLPELDSQLIQEDTREVCNKFYLNGYLHITSSEIKLMQYTSLQNLVFYNRILQRNYSHFIGGIYTEFLSLCFNEISENTQRTIGYLAHEYKDETTAYIVVCVEKAIDPKHGGGSGKNIFCQLFQQITTFKSRAGAGAKFDERFFQVWNYQKIFCISDVDKDFNFSFLKEPAGGNIQWKRLFKNEESVDSKDAPKLIIQTNYSYEVSDGGLARRIIPIEFTDYFTKAGGVDKVTGKHFPKDWTESDWNGYDTFTALCVQKWLQSGRKLSADTLSSTGWEKQFMLAYGQTIYDFIQEYWAKWIETEFVSNEDFKRQLETFYNDNNISPHYRPTMIKINKAIVEYSQKNKVYFNKETVRRKELMLLKGKLFGINGEEPAPF